MLDPPELLGCVSLFFDVVFLTLLDFGLIGEPARERKSYPCCSYPFLK